MGKNESAIRLFQPLLRAIIENANLEKIVSFFTFVLYILVCLTALLLLSLSGGLGGGGGKNYPRHFPNNDFKCSSFYKEHGAEKF